MSPSLQGSQGFLALLVTISGLALSGCGGNESAPSSGSSTYLSTAQAKLDRAYAGTYKEPPTSGPRPRRGENVWIISCGQALESCALGSNTEKAVGRQIGWKMTIFDGKLDPATFNAGIRQALAARADGIILSGGIDCPVVKAALQQAKRAKIAVVGLLSLNCDEASPGEQPLFTSINYGTGGATFSRFTTSWAAPKADWLISQTRGRARVINFAEGDLPTEKLIDTGFTTEFSKCGTCRTVATVNFSVGDIGPKLQQKAQQAILQHPEANAVHIPYDSLVFAGIGAAIQASGKSGRLAVIAGEGNPTNLKLIRSDRGQDAANVIDIGWLSWAAVDTLNRVLAGQKAVPEGIGWQIVDREHNLSGTGTYKPPVDFKAAYRKAWGLSG